MDTTKRFVNLTSGFEWLGHGLVPDGYVRIQSTWLEQKRFWPVIHDLDYAFLLAIAMGHDVMVYDTSAHKQESRAIYQGLPWIDYVLNRVWLDNADRVPWVRGHNVQDYFDTMFWINDPARDMAMRKLKYIARITGPTRVSIKGMCARSDHDGQYEWYSNKLKENES